MNHWELTLFLLTAACAGVPLLMRAPLLGRPISVMLGAGLVCFCLTGVIVWSGPEDLEKPEYLLPGQKAKRWLPREINDEGFASSNSCQSCHPGNYASWHNTFHRSMTQIASPTSVLAPFDNVVLENNEITYRLWREGDEFWVELPDPDKEYQFHVEGIDLNSAEGKNQICTVARRIVMTTGSHHFQGYWVPSTRGRELMPFPWVYVISEQRWVPYEAVFLRPPDGGRRFALWNNNCIQCHALDGNPGGVDSGQLFSDIVEFGIGCEACHGPAEEHIRKHQNPLTRYQHRLRETQDETILNPAKCSAEVSSQVCGQCHSAFFPQDLNDWWKRGYAYQAGDELEQTRHLFHYGDELARELSQDRAATAYWGDGTGRVGGREYLAMIKSPCFEHDIESRKMSCLSCHSMHHSDPNDQLADRMNGNHACLQCHDSYAANLEKHTHHPPDSQGSLCYNCHMPHTSYALLKAIRSHRVESPNVRNSTEFGKPNGCNLCHLDKALEWTSNYLSSWYGVEPAELSPEERRTAASLLWLLKGDAAQRAVTAWSYGWKPAHEASGKQWQAAFLSSLLEDPYAAVRFIAFDSLRRLPGFKEVKYDFIASATIIKQQAQSVLLQWNAIRDKRLPDDTSSILMDSSGSLKVEEISRLLQQRDDRHVEFPE